MERLIATNYVEPEIIRDRLERDAKMAFSREASACEDDYIRIELLNAGDYVTATMEKTDTTMTFSVDCSYAATDPRVQDRIDFTMQTFQIMQNDLVPNDIDYMITQNIEKLERDVVEQIIEPMLTGG